MNKNAIQKYAIWARNELIEQIKQRAYQYGISVKGYGDENAAVIAGRVLSADEKRQRTAFVHEIQKHGYQEAVDEVAYTWFNRFVALRFMEVNDYLSTHVRVFSDSTGGFNPEILKNVLHLELEGLDKSKVSEMLNANQTEELYRYLLLTQCNVLNAALPEMFEKLGTYTEMLLPNNILKQESVLAHLVKDIDEDDWKDAVQIIGWMYQYYNTEPKQAVFDGLKKNVKITKEKIPAATQLFTPDWIVRYMVENSLGRLWLELHPSPMLKANWKYYLDEAEQTPEVAEHLRVLRSHSPMKSPEDIRLIDPCMGSGHILVYAFDVLMHIYESEGYNPRDASKLILEKNIYGLDIDRRAYQLAYFSLMMKARHYNRRIFTEDIKPQVYHPTGFPDGEEYGSLVKVDMLPPRPIEKSGQLSLEDTAYDVQLNAWNFKRLLAQKYDVVVTNPPYMGASGMSVRMSDFVKKYYPDSKSDLSTCFMEQTLRFCKLNGMMAMINIPVWMFLSSYEKLRHSLLNGNSFINMLHFGRGVFGSDFGTTSFVITKRHLQGYRSSYRRLFEKSGSVDTLAQKEEWLLQGVGQYTAVSDNFGKIPGRPIAYQFQEHIFDVFAGCKKLSDVALTRLGMTTADNEKFVRLWSEVQGGAVCLDAMNSEEVLRHNAHWVPYNKGGKFRKWYGNLEHIVFWKDDGYAIKNFGSDIGHIRSTVPNTEYYFKECLTWSKVSIGSIAFRYRPIGSIFDVAGACLFGGNQLYLLGLLNSKVTMQLLEVLAPSLNFEGGQISSIPVIEQHSDKVESIVKNNISVSHIDWDVFETSWDFKRHPLVCGEQTIATAFSKWECEAEERFETLKANEEELNRIFIEIYGLQDEITLEVEDKDVTVRRADLGREIRSLISYAVGCMFGRYSLDTEGLAYAGDDWDVSKYHSFIPDKDNILPLCDDEYFDDDIMGRFVDFIRLVYGAETLEENLKYIADALGGNGTPREVIRNYFLNDFYKDHCKTYQKRPIYWLFDSGKMNGFKALIYLHRYSRDLLAKLRTDYVHEQQERYRTQLSHIATALTTATGSERARLLKQQDKLSEQLKEITAFEEMVHHLADQNIEIDLDDGVKKNYGIFTDVLAKI